MADADAEAALTSRMQRSNRFFRKRLWMRMTRDTFTPEEDPFPVAGICVSGGTPKGMLTLTSYLA